jgi:single-stranded-DNA-specific exonuclease
LIDENRVFAKLGLEALRSAVNPGLKALLEVAQLGGKPLTSGEVAFRVAPRINAAGRMDVARDVVELFSVKDPERAREIAGRLDQLNAARQEEERHILEAIQTRFDEDASLKEAYCLVIDGDGWHRGVIGITATRVVERYGRPALVISRDGGEAHGSGRSIAPFHLLNALESCRDLFTRYGGHSHAVGFALPASRVPELKAQLDAYARRHLTLADFEPVLHLDAELSLDRVTPELFHFLSRLEPFGVGNPEPVFTATSTRLMAPPRVLKEKHVKLRLSSTENREPATENWRRAITFNAMGWRMAERMNQEKILQGDELDIAFTISHNDHPDFGGLELSLRDFRRTRRSEHSSEITVESQAI